MFVAASLKRTQHRQTRQALEQRGNCVLDRPVEWPEPVRSSLKRLACLLARCSFPVRIFGPIRLPLAIPNDGIPAFWFSHSCASGVSRPELQCISCIRSSIAPLYLPYHALCSLPVLCVGKIGARTCLLILSEALRSFYYVQSADRSSAK